MVRQATILDEIAAAHLAQEGMEVAATNAERFFPKWTDKALVVLKSFLLQYREVFMVEEVRKFAEKTALEVPPSERSWGFVIRKARDLGWIEHAGFNKTKNVKAHGTPASLWRSLL